MLRFHSPFDGKRYIGDNQTGIFHDLLYEATPTSSEGCRIDHIPPEEVRTFESDTVNEALLRGYVCCPCCLRKENEATRTGLAAEGPAKDRCS
jgi:hypothetical protein